MAPALTSLVTTAPAPTMAPSPMATPGMAVALAAIRVSHETAVGRWPTYFIDPAMPSNAPSMTLLTSSASLGVASTSGPT